MLQMPIRWRNDNYNTDSNVSEFLHVSRPFQGHRETTKAHTPLSPVHYFNEAAAATNFMQLGFSMKLPHLSPVQHC